MTSILTRGNEVRVNTTTLDSQLDQKITTLSDGSYVIVWQSFAQDGSVGGIYSQRYDSNGNKIGAETLINTTTSGIQNAPSIAALETGGYVICWTGNGSQVGQVDSSGVFYKLYDVDGNAVGNETLVNSTTASTQDRPVVSGTAGGGFAITWTSFAQDTAASNGVYMRLFTEGGTAQTAEIAVNVTTSGNQLSRSVTTLSDGSIIVAWTDDTLDGSGIGVFMRRFSAAGTALTGEALVNTTTASNQTLPVVKSLPNGGYIVVWSGNGSQTGNIDNFGVFFQIYDANNNKVGGETLVNSFTLDGQDFPSMAVLTDGGFVIVWPSFNQDGSSFGAFGQRFDENGAKIGPEFQINSYTVNGQDKPVVSALNDGGFVVTWQSELQDGSGLGVYSRRYGAATTLTGTQYLYGTIDSDRLDGGIGGDFMYGGKGSDTYIVSSSNDVVSENANEGNDFIEASISYSLDGTNVENLTLTGMDNLSGVGSSANNRLIGNEGDNSLEGLEGNDKLYGGDGNDNLTGDFGNDTLYGENGNDEIDGLEDNDLIYGGFGQDTLNGGLGNDTVYGGDDNDLIYASEGADTLLGEGGIDTIDASILSAGIYINLAAGRARFQNTNTYLSGFENITGSAFNDTLYGDSGNNVIFGDNGADIMAGGAGDDVYFYDDSGDRANEADGQGDDQLFSSVNVNLTGRYIETVFLTGNDNTSIFGNEKATELWGNSGNNLLTSGLGADTMFGGLGNDTYIVDDAGDLVTENTAEGTDAVKATITYSLTGNVENLVLLGTANIDGTGNGLANVVQGNSANNRLNGGAGGNDTLAGFLGDDTYVFDLGFGVDTIVNETGGTDTILFGAGITSAMIITQDVGADRYYAIADGVHVASACANRVRIVGGASGTIETIAYTPPASPAASAAVLTQAIAGLSVSDASEATSLTATAASATTSLASANLLENQKLVA